MEPTLYDTRTLLRVVEDLYGPSTFILETFFPQEQTFDTETIDFDLVKTAQKLAPFVSPMVQGRPMRGRGTTTRSFKPAYLKPKDAVDPNRPFKRRAGERYMGEMTPAQRRDAVIADILRDHTIGIDLRLEWMAVQAMVNGKVTVSGEDYETVEVDFGRDSELSIQLSGAAQWGEAGVKPTEDLEEWFELVGDKSSAPVTDVVMDTKAWQLLRADENFRDTLDNRRGTSASFELAPDSRINVQWKGSTGTTDYWVYTAKYEDDDGNQVPFLPEHTVIPASRLIDGVQAFGGIKDPRAGYVPARWWPKNWINDDPPTEFVMTQSAPLVIPSRTNASACIRVREPA